jgi:hypothetical protein
MENTLAIAGFGPFVANEIVVWCKKRRIFRTLKKLVLSSLFFPPRVLL